MRTLSFGRQAYSPAAMRRISLSNRPEENLSIWDVTSPVRMQVSDPSKPRTTASFLREETAGSSSSVASRRTRTMAH